MIQVSDKQFEQFVDEGIEAINPIYQKRLQNVVIVAEEAPSEEQLRRQNIQPGRVLLGLHEGTTRAAQVGAHSGLLPDKITIFKRPHELISSDIDDLKERVRHTVWHEVAHYFGLDHDRIHKLDARS